MMLKKTDPLEDTVVTEPETPPLEPPHQQQPNSQLIHRIIASNEELIHQQMMAIRDLQRNNADLEDKLKLATQRYDALCELAFSGRCSHTETIAS
jgi:hypothetical protein